MCAFHVVTIFCFFVMSIYHVQVLYSSCRHLLIVQVMSSHVKNYFTVRDMRLVSCETLLPTCTINVVSFSQSQLYSGAVLNTSQ